MRYKFLQYIAYCSLFSHSSRNLKKQALKSATKFVSRSPGGPCSDGSKMQVNAKQVGLLSFGRVKEHNCLYHRQPINGSRIIMECFIKQVYFHHIHIFFSIEPGENHEKPPRSPTFWWFIERKCEKIVMRCSEGDISLVQTALKCK